MRFTTDDGLFGFVVTPLTQSGMYRFQVVIGGELVGDSEPCFLESAMNTLGRLRELDDSRLGQASMDAVALMDLLASDGALDDAALLQIAESLDSWKVRAYSRGETATFLAARYVAGTDSAQGAVSLSVVPLTEYATVFEVARGYWAKTRQGNKL